MNKKNIAILAVLICLLAAIGLARSRQPVPETADRSHSSSQAMLAPSSQRPAPENVAVPQHVAYGLFFGEMMALRKKAEEMERVGKPAAALRDFDKIRAQLSDTQSQALDKIAADCNDKVVKLNDLARAIIDRERARHPHGKLKEGEQLPLPPKGLKVLEEQRKDTILEARDQLRSAFGEKEFKRFDDFVQQDIAARTKGGPARQN